MADVRRSIRMVWRSNALRLALLMGSGVSLRPEILHYAIDPRRIRECERLGGPSPDLSWRAAESSAKCSVKRRGVVEPTSFGELGYRLASPAWIDKIAAEGIKAPHSDVVRHAVVVLEKAIQGRPGDAGYVADPIRCQPRREQFTFDKGQGLSTVDSLAGHLGKACRSRRWLPIGCRQKAKCGLLNQRHVANHQFR